MPDILHRFTVDAPRERVHDLIATKEGVERWWNAHPNTRDDATLRVFFEGEEPGRGHARSSRTRPSGSSGGWSTAPPIGLTHDHVVGCRWHQRWGSKIPPSASSTTSRAKRSLNAA
jgi:uncharacterized protein YndB with AHSA1/START domain